MTGEQVNWPLLANAALGNFLAGTSSRIFAVSLPTVATSLETTIVGISWAVIAYQISQISLSLIFGRIGDIYGRHTLFGLGLIVSSLAALACGLSQSVGQLILFRMFQGMGASMTQSQGRALALEALPKESSGRAQGFMTTAFHSGVLIGPSIGGLIIDYIHWRAVFFFLIPIAMCGMVLTLINRMKGNVPQPVAVNEEQKTIDYLGALLLIAATTSLIACVDHRIMESLTPALRLSLVVAFVVVFIGFLYRERTTPSPILDLSLFRIRMFTLSSMSLLLVGVAQVMIGFLLPFYLQDVLHLKPSFIGLLFVSAPIFTVTLSPLVGWAVDKMGPRVPATIGISFLAGAGFFGSYLRADSHWLAAVGVLALWGLATALFFTSNHTAMITCVPPEHRGVATGAIYVTFGLGTTFGVSLGTMLLTLAFRYHTGDPTATPTAANPEMFVRAMNFSFMIGGSMALLAMLSSALRGERKSRALIALFFLFIAPARFDAAEIPIIALGAGQFIFSRYEGAAERAIKVWTYRPKELAAETPVLFVMHGVERNGERYRNEWQPYAARGQALLLVPEFSAAHFPGSRNYSAPRQANSDQSDGATPFAFAAIEQIFDQVIKANKLTASDYRIYGHSAGAQFVHRFVLANPQARAKVAVAANAGWYMMPDHETKFPYGLKGSGITTESLKGAFAKKLVILLGEKDTDPNHPQLSRTAQAMRQGVNRLERGQTFFRVAQRQAETLNIPFNWEIRTVPNVAHSDVGMASAAAPLLLR